MDQESKDKLKLLPKVVCHKCQSKKSYRNPMAKCYECQNKFCFDHIDGAQHKDGMSKNEEYRSVCDDCRKIHGYE